MQGVSLHAERKYCEEESKKAPQGAFFMLMAFGQDKGCRTGTGSRAGWWRWPISMRKWRSAGAIFSLSRCKVSFIAVSPFEAGLLHSVGGWERAGIQGFARIGPVSPGGGERPGRPVFTGASCHSGRACAGWSAIFRCGAGCAGACPGSIAGTGIPSCIQEA